MGKRTRKTRKTRTSPLAAVGKGVCICPQLPFAYIRVVRSRYPDHVDQLPHLLRIAETPRVCWATVWLISIEDSPVDIVTQPSISKQGPRYALARVLYGHVHAMQWLLALTHALHAAACLHAFCISALSFHWAMPRDTFWTFFSAICHMFW